METLKLGYLCSACAVLVACGGTSAKAPGSAEAEFDSLVNPTQAANSTYFTIHADAQNCPQTSCTGYSVERVNRRYTFCDDGQARESCYVAQLDLKLLGLDAMSEASLRAHIDTALLRGAITSEKLSETKTATSLHVEEAWLGHAYTNPTGTVLRVKSSNLSCVTEPCERYTAERLNSDQPKVPAIALTFDAIEDSGSKAQSQFNKAAGVMVVAELSTTTGPAGISPLLKATEYYLPVGPKGLLEEGADCGKPGLASCPVGQFCKFAPEAACGRLDKAGVCEIPPEACPEVYKPVCGCDSVTYSNECVAASNGVSVQREGECITIL